MSKLTEAFKIEYDNNNDKDKRKSDSVNDKQIIKQLTAKEHLRERYGMWIGSNDSPVHLLTELIDNAADECMNGFSSKMSVSMDLDNCEYTVGDYGRGIPLKQKGTKKDIPVLIATELFTGGKFDDMSNYNFMSGLHGVGMKAVNALSSSFVIAIKESDKKIIEYKFSDFDNYEKTIIKPKNHPIFSTEVSFKPINDFFITNVIDLEIIKERLISIKSYKDMSDIEISLLVIHNNEIKEIPIENTIVPDFTRECAECINMTISDKNNDYMELLIGFTKEVKQKYFHSVVNTIPVKSGSHQNILENLIKNYLFNKAQRNKMHIKKEDVLLGSRILCLLKLKETTFTGQTKQQLGNSQTQLNHLINENIIEKFFNNFPEFVDNWLKYVQSYRIELDSKKSINKKQTRGAVLVDGLKDCTSKQFEERELFILEGESAGGNLIICEDRNTATQAILPLKGKIKNVLEVSHEKVLNNKEISNIFTAIGIKPYSTDLNTLRYNYINLSSDADKDGGHITALLIALFDTVCPKLIDEGHLYVVEAPLYGCWIKKKYIPIYTEEDLKKYRDMGIEIYRYKGLGEMQPDELGTVMCNHKMRRLIKIIRPMEPKETVLSIFKNKADIIKDYILN